MYSDDHQSGYRTAQTYSDTQCVSFENQYKAGVYSQVSLNYADVKGFENLN